MPPCHLRMFKKTGIPLSVLWTIFHKPESGRNYLAKQVADSKTFYKDWGFYIQNHAFESVSFVVRKARSMTIDTWPNSNI